MITFDLMILVAVMFAAALAGMAMAGCACCGGSGPVPCCGGISLPTTLHLTISGTGGCDGTYPLTLQVSTPSFIGWYYNFSDISPTCTGPFAVQLGCFTSGNAWILTICCPAQSVGTGWQSGLQAGSTCSPLHLNFSIVITASFCCSSSGGSNETVTAVVTV